MVTYEWAIVTLPVECALIAKASATDGNNLKTYIV
jgi:hypothetical protein